MRGLTAFIVSVPVSLAASFILVALTESVIESVSALMLPVIWGGTLVYLVQKPLPSDIIGDALYALAGLLVVGPLLGYGLMIVRAQFTSATLDKSVGFVLVELLSIEFMILWPATFLFVLGYAGNAWAARRLRNSAE